MPDVNILFIGSGGELERKLMQDIEFAYLPIDAQAILGRGISGIFKFIKAFFPKLYLICKIYKKNSVKLVIGFGGFPSFLPVLTSKVLRLPSFVFEQNAKIGLANKFLGLFATKIFAVPGANAFFRKDVVSVLNPVREEIKAVEDWVAPQNGAKIRVLVVGGSQGAVSLNTEIMKLKDFFETTQIKLIH